MAWWPLPDWAQILCLLAVFLGIVFLPLQKTLRTSSRYVLPTWVYRLVQLSVFVFVTDATYQGLQSALGSQDGLGLTAGVVGAFAALLATGLLWRVSQLAAWLRRRRTDS